MRSIVLKLSVVTAVISLALPVFASNAIPVSPWPTGKKSSIAAIPVSPWPTGKKLV